LFSPQVDNGFFFGNPKKNSLATRANKKKISTSPKKNFRPVAKKNASHFCKIANSFQSFFKFLPNGGTGVPPNKQWSV
jgi:hypothetical protein